MKKFLLLLSLTSLLGCHRKEAVTDHEPGRAPLEVSALPAPPAGDISGHLVLAPAVAPSVHAGDTIFVIARNAGTGRPVAVARLVAPEAAQFPLAFHLGGAEAAMHGGSLFGKVRLVARVDKDGDAATTQPGDIVGELADLVSVPASDVTLVLDKTL